MLHVCTDLSCRLAGAELPEGAHPSPCLGLCERAPASLRTIAGEQPRELQLPESGPPLPQAGDEGLRLLRRIAAGVDPESLDAYRAHGGYAALRRAVELGPAGVAARGERVAPARARRRRLPDGREVGSGRAPAGASALPRLQRRRVRAGDVQGPRADGERPVRARRGDDDRRVCDRLRARLRLRAGGVPARARAARARVRAGAGARPPRARRDGRRLRLRPRAAHRRRRVRVRRGDGAVPVDRGLPRRAAQQAALPRRGRPVREAHRREQRRDPLQRPRGRV